MPRVCGAHGAKGEQESMASKPAREVEKGSSVRFENGPKPWQTVKEIEDCGNNLFLVTTTVAVTGDYLMDVQWDASAGRMTG